MNNLLFLSPIKPHIDSISINVLCSLLQISDKLLTSSDNKVCINLKLTINFILCFVDLSLSSSSLVGTEKVIYFSVFSPKQSN